tara:strand:+ start:825 stop:1760 length:936 start_codon:yes stop_codon:yes gene_type:complete
VEVGKENINIGLTKDEFELVINNSHNPELIKKYVHKLDNCDLSKSAIELIREEDLDTINRITNEILLKYPVISNKDGNVKWLIGGIALLILFAGIVLFKKETADNSTPNQTILNEKIKEDNSEDSLRLIPFSQNKEFEFDEKSDSSKSKLNSPDSILNPVLTDDSSSKPKIKNKTNPIKESKNANSKSTKISYKRKVRLIKSLKQVPDKYKGELYSENDLVDFYGGNKNLEKELLNNFKGKIKDTHIPKKNTSIVFKFSVTSNGKIKDINIQSRVNIELEKIIKETAFKLTKWTKGSKRIPVIYTVYITFK